MIYSSIYSIDAHTSYKVYTFYHCHHLQHNLLYIFLCSLFSVRLLFFLCEATCKSHFESWYNIYVRDPFLRKRDVEYCFVFCTTATNTLRTSNSHSTNTSSTCENVKRILFFRHPY